MSLRQKIEADLKQAMLARNELEKETLRMAKADLLNREVDLGRDLTDEEAVVVLQKAVKARRDSIESYRAGGREESAKQEELEIAILARFLPKALDEAETRAAITALIGELGLAGKKDLGRLMKELKARHEGLDGKVASKLAGELLG